MNGVTGYDLPRTLFRVVFDEGFGWPHCTRRERARRTYATAEQAARMVATIEALPTHHKLLGVWICRTVNWEPIDTDVLTALLPRDEGEPNDRDD